MSRRRAFVACLPYRFPKPNIVRVSNPNDVQSDDPGVAVPRRKRLQREDIVAAALVLLDEGGMAALSMRNLATALGVKAGSLYHHVPSKRHLMAAVADEIVAAALRPPADETWDVALVAGARQLREALRAHRDGVQVVASTFTSGPNTVALARQWTRATGGIGLPLQRQILIATALFSYILGHVLDEASVDNWDSAASALAAMDQEDRALAIAYLDVATDADTRFEAGLELLIAGVRHQSEGAV